MDPNITNTDYAPGGRKENWGPEHVNRNVICAIDIRPGGDNANDSDLLEICILPLNHSFKVHEHFKLFNIKIRPSWPVDKKAARLNEERLAEFRSSPFDSVGSLRLFETWAEKSIFLKWNKKIMPLVWDWGRVKPFLKAWLGDQHYERYIDDSVRDMLPVLNFINDRSSLWGETIKFVHPTFGQFIGRNGIELIETNSLMANCKALIDAQYQILRGYISGYSVR